MFDFDQESCAERIMDPYLEDTVKLTDTCLSDHSSLREPMNLFSGFAELRNVARNAVSTLSKLGFMALLHVHCSENKAWSPCYYVAPREIC